MKQFHYIYTLLALLGLAILTSLAVSCIREDTSDCPGTLRIYLTFSPATYARTGVNPEEVDKMDLFVFDKQGRFLGRWTDEKPVLAPGYYMTIPSLPDGEYRFIAWGGMRECYSLHPATFETGQTTLKEALLYLDPLSGTLNTCIHPLFHAAKTDYVHNITREQRIDMPLEQAYNTINLTTEGIPDVDNDFRFSITDNNGKYDFEYSFVDCNEFTYITPCTPNTDGQPKASLNVLKLAADRKPQLEIYNVTKEKNLYRADLVSLLNQIEGIDYEKIHTYDIHIKFTTDDTDLTATVTINGWQVTVEDEVLY